MFPLSLGQPQLPQSLHDYVTNRVASGAYASATEVIAAALELLEARDRPERVSSGAQGENATLLRQQMTLARFGELAMRSDSLDEILEEACRLVGEALGTDVAKVLELQADGETLLVRAGVGLEDGIVGERRIKATGSSSEGHALRTGEPVISADLNQESRFLVSETLRAQGVFALVNVVILGPEDERPYGVLEVNSHEPRQFTSTDISFLRGYANLLATAVDRLRSRGALKEGTAELRNLVEQRTQELSDSRDFTRLALSSVGGVGVWTYNAATNQFFCSAAIAELYGIDADEAGAGISGAGFLANVHPDDRASLKATMDGGLKRFGDLELEYRICHPDGSTRWVLSRGHTYADEDGNPTRRVGIGVDMTKQRQLEEQLRQAQKMEAVGQLTGGLAHDFNNLLAGIIGSLELLQTRVKQGRFTELARYIAAAEGAAERAASLTHRLLAFSRRQTLDPKPTNVGQLVIDMEDLIARTIGPEIKLEMISQADLPAALVDPNQLENALLNLCINARDAMPDGGKIIVETAQHQVDRRMSEELEVPPADYLTLSVSDNGMGMSPAVVARAFDPFFTTKPFGQGTGLGLSMIYGFARQSGGQVRIYSEPGRGTTVRLYLPPHVGLAVEPEEKRTVTDTPKAEDGQTVLVVDDEPTVRMLITEVLEELGYAAMEAADGAAGLGILRSDVRIDLLVTDVGLPGGINGRQLADAGQTLRPDMKVLFITGYAEHAVLNHGHLGPNMEVMTKPFPMQALATRINAMISPLADSSKS